MFFHTASISSTSFSGPPQFSFIFWVEQLAAERQVKASQQKCKHRHWYSKKNKTTQAWVHSFIHTASSLLYKWDFFHPHPSLRWQPGRLIQLWPTVLVVVIMGVFHFGFSSIIRFVYIVLNGSIIKYFKHTSDHVTMRNCKSDASGKLLKSSVYVVLSGPFKGTESTLYCCTFTPEDLSASSLCWG